MRAQPRLAALHIGRRVQELPRPLLGRVAGQALLHGGVAPPLLGLRHLQRPPHGVHDAFLVERVHRQGLVQLVGCAGHLGEHERPAGPVVAGKVFLAHEVHAVAQRRDQHDVARGVQADQPLEGQRAVVVVHGRPVHGGVLAVDEPHQLVHLLLQGGVRRHVLARRHRYQHQHHAAAPLREAVQERVEGQQAFGDALGIVQPLHRQHELAALVPLLLSQFRHQAAHRREARGVAVATVVDAQRERVHLCETAVG